MTELKTLKDLAFDGNRYEHKVNVAKIKQEAIKWVNEWVKQVEYAETGKEEQLLKSKCLAFRDFFNLTEEDLK